MGNSQLLSTNSVWGPIIRDHCSGKELLVSIQVYQALNMSF